MKIKKAIAALCSKLQQPAGRVFYSLYRRIRRAMIYRQVMWPGKIRLSEPAIETIAVLLADLVLFAGFLAITGIPMALCGVRPLAILAVDIIVWLAMDGIACVIRYRRIRKTRNAYRDEWGCCGPEDLED